MARITLPDLSSMSAEQTEVCNEAKAGPRGKVPAPMIAWLQNPELARRGQHLGALLRFSTSLPPKLSELAILICARHWTSHHEWTAHKKIALEAGLEPDIIDAIAIRATPIFNDDTTRLVYQLSHEILTTGRVSDENYKKGIQGLETRGMAELVAILGYYCLVSLTLNVFELGLPENVAVDLQDPQYRPESSPGTEPTHA